MSKSKHIISETNGFFHKSTYLCKEIMRMKPLEQADFRW